MVPSPTPTRVVSSGKVPRHPCERWTEPRLVIDAAALTAEEAASLVCDEIASRRPAG
jgi:hypothetical protein